MSEPAPAAAPRRPRWWLFAAAAAVLAAGVVLLAVNTHGGGSSPGGLPANARSVEQPVPSGRAADLVVHDGDTVIGSSQVEVWPGEPVRFCADGPILADPRGPCPGIDVTGVDVRRLTRRFTNQGTVYGQATLTGVYRSGTLTVTGQGPPAPDPQQFRSQYIPCKAPPGGWVPITRTLGVGNPYMGINLFPAVRYQRSHPGAMLKLAALRASPSVVVAYIVTPGDPSRVRSALSARYPEDLCVIKSRFTAEQLTASQAALRVKATYVNRLGSLYSWDALGAGDALGPDAQLCITFDVSLMSAELAEFIDSQPAGLIQTTTFLRPVAALSRD